MFKRNEPIPFEVLEPMVKQHTIKELTSLLGVSKSKVYRYLVEYGLHKPRKYNTKKVTLTRRELRELAKKLTTREIAAQLGVRDDKVRFELRRHRIKPLRKHGGALSTISRDVLVDLYCHKGLTIEEIARELHKGPRIVSRELRRHLIELRPIGGENRHDLTGHTFDRLKVLTECGRVERHVLWLCQCECGKTTTATTSMLNAGYKRSCGCLMGKRQRKTSKPLGSYSEDQVCGN